MYVLIENQLRTAAEALRSGEVTNPDELATLLALAADIVHAYDEGRQALRLRSAYAHMKALEQAIDQLRDEIRDREVRSVSLGFKIHRRDELIVEQRARLMALGENPPEHVSSLRLHHLERRLEELENRERKPPTHFDGPRDV